MRLWLKQLANNPRRGLIILPAVLGLGIALWLLLTNFGLIGVPDDPAIPAFMQNAEKAKTTDATTNVKKIYEDAVAYLEALNARISHSQPGPLGQPSQTPRPTVKPRPSRTPAPAVASPRVIVLAEYCEGGKAHVNFKFQMVFTGKIDWSSADEGPEESVTFVYGRTPLDFHDPAGLDLVIHSPAGANPAIDMKCVLVPDARYEALLNCTGPEDSTIPILVGGSPLDVSFMACHNPGENIGPGGSCGALGCR